MKQGELPENLKQSSLEMDKMARSFGLDYYPVFFTMVDFDTMMEVTSYVGMPKRFPHWYFGMQQKYFEKEQGYGLSHIYELVINTNPSIAYLLETNPTVIQKMVIAHVYGHADFFKNNYLFSNTNRNMHNVMSDHAEMVRFYQQKYGYEAVEKTVEVCMSLENLIDYDSSYIDLRPLDLRQQVINKDHGCSDCDACGDSCGDSEDKKEGLEYRLRTSMPYMDSFVNPEDFINDMQKIESERKKEDDRFPLIAQRDVLRFLIKHGEGFQPWQKDILSVVRDESHYFLPQKMTKIMNEGWAVYWHRKIMEDLGFASDDFIQYSKVNAGVLATAPGSINPYYIGYMIWKDIEERWDKGRHGPEYDDERNAEKLKNWDTKELGGLKKMFEVRNTMGDYEFLNTFFTPDLIERKQFYTFELDDRDDWYKIKDRDPQKIRKHLMGPLINCGEPVIEVLNGNFNNSRELLLLHKSYDGTILEQEKMERTIKNLYKVWGRNVHLIMVKGGKPNIITFDGDKLNTRGISQNGKEFV